MVLNNSLLYNMLVVKEETFKTRMIFKSIDTFGLLNIMWLQFFSHVLVTRTHIIEGLSAFLLFFSRYLGGSSTGNTNTYLCNPGCDVRV